MRRIPSWNWFFPPQSQVFPNPVLDFFPSWNCFSQPNPIFSPRLTSSASEPGSGMEIRDNPRFFLPQSHFFPAQSHFPPDSPAAPRIPARAGGCGTIRSCGGSRVRCPTERSRPGTGPGAPDPDPDPAGNPCGKHRESAGNELGTLGMSWE